LNSILTQAGMLFRYICCDVSCASTKYKYMVHSVVYSVTLCCCKNSFYLQCQGYAFKRNAYTAYKKKKILPGQ